MAKPADRTPWAKIGAADTEDICRRLGAEYVAVWCRLSIIAAKTQRNVVAVSRRELGFDCGLSRGTVRRHLDGLEREGFVTVERHRDDSRGDRPNTYVILRGPYATPGQNPASPRGQNLTTPVYHGEVVFCGPPSQEYSSNTQERQETPNPPMGDGTFSQIQDTGTETLVHAQPPIQDPWTRMADPEMIQTIVRRLTAADATPAHLAAWRAAVRDLAARNADFEAVRGAINKRVFDEEPKYAPKLPEPRRLTAQWFLDLVQFYHTAERE